ncbi:MAG TPA: SDR family oxidoreductase, partial [Candidatus Binatia bacterium]|nr:SDR family oxidoreductase [Candidatus Binatia bacterium]
EALLKRDQKVIGLDNFSTGRESNLTDVRERVGADKWENFSLIEADVSDPQACERACVGIDYILHQAALGSVPRSISNPLNTNHSNVTGFLNLLWAASQAGVRRFVYASSSSVYGDHPALPKVEDQIGNCLSPYAVSKRVNELYALAFSKCYSIGCIGLRYFNVFGARQDPQGAYAAVIPKWIAAMIENRPVHIHGDGETSRDFCYVANVVQANLLSALSQNSDAVNQVYNVAVAGRTSLNQLFGMLRSRLLPDYPHIKELTPVYLPFRAGDVRHSLADISRAQSLLAYEPTHDIQQGLDEALPWYTVNLQNLRYAEAALL